MTTPNGWQVDSRAIAAALRVSYATVAWSLIGGCVSLAVAVQAASLSLAGLGVGVLIDVLSSLVLIHRFRLHRASGVFPERAEQRAQVVAGCCLLALGVTLVAGSVQRLIAQKGSDPDAMALALAAASLLVLPVLARWKYRVARSVGSPALRTDAHITLVGATMSGLTLVALAVTAGLGWTWPDPVAAAIIGIVAANEARKALTARR
jgi:divalent metal cation (Fe/Co/Zn/Cd) transporter